MTSLPKMTDRVNLPLTDRQYRAANRFFVRVGCCVVCRRRFKNKKGKPQDWRTIFGQPRTKWASRREERKTLRLEALCSLCQESLDAWTDSRRREAAALRSLGEK